MKKTVCSILAMALALLILLPGCNTTGGKESPVSSDTLRWFNATYAVLTTKNGGDLNLIGGVEANALSKVQVIDLLEQSWDVVDRASADETLQWLLEEGHNAQLLANFREFEMDDLTRDDLLEILSYGISEEDAPFFLVIYDAHAQFGDSAIVGWDLSRAMNLCAWYYLAGYYTYEEAMDASLEVATRLQSTFSSWDEMVQSYLYGFQYWNEDDIQNPDSDSYERKEIFETLKADAHNPYSVDWNLTFEKDW